MKCRSRQSSPRFNFYQVLIVFEPAHVVRASLIIFDTRYSLLDILEHRVSNTEQGMMKDGLNVPCQIQFYQVLIVFWTSTRGSSVVHHSIFDIPCSIFLNTEYRTPNKPAGRQGMMKDGLNVPCQISLSGFPACLVGFIFICKNTFVKLLCIKFIMVWNST